MYFEKFQRRERYQKKIIIIIKPPTHSPLDFTLHPKKKKKNNKKIKKKKEN